MKTVLTAEQIADRTDQYNGISNIRAINQAFRDQDESHLFPISGQFDATERAIRQARSLRQDYPVYGLEYCYLLDSLISDIVNNESNW